ncbi:MAG: beta-lactamase family protein [bacterium]|nr:beta-lactamase family protein [bacterium]
MRFTHLFLSLFLSLCAFPSSSATLPKTEKKDKNFAHWAKERFDTLMEKDRMPGGGFVLISKGKSIVKSTYGVREKGKTEKIKITTPFRLGSTSKPLTTTLVGLLTRNSSLKWEDTLQDILPNLKNLGRGPLTLKNLAEQSTGFLRHAYTHLVDQEYSLEKIIYRLLHDKDLSPHKIGQVHTYQNVIFSFLGLILEKKFSKSFADLTQEHLLSPLKMTEASASLEAFGNQDVLAIPHTFNEETQAYEPVPVKDHYYAVASAAAFTASLNDVEKFLQANLANHPNSLPKDLLKTLHTPRLKTPGLLNRFKSEWKEKRVKEAHYGLGWRILDYENHKIVCHWGMLEGVRTLFVVLPDQDSAFAMIFNGEPPFISSFMAEVADRILGLEDLHPWSDSAIKKAHRARYLKSLTPTPKTKPRRLQKI